MWKEREAVDRVEVSEDCYSKDKQGHQSKLKKENYVWNGILHKQAHVLMRACTPA